MNDARGGAFDPEAILAALDRHGVRYVLIGGTAAVIHGVPTVTTDVDLVPERSPANLSRLVAALAELGALRVTEPDLPPSPPGVETFEYRIELFDSPAGGIDVVFSAERIGGYEELVGRAEHHSLGGLEIAIASLDDLIMAKQWSDRPKDRIHLRLLLAVQQELRDRRRRQDH